MPLSDDDRTLDVVTAARLALGEHELRRDLASSIQRAFLIGNLAVWILIVVLLVVDIVMIATGREKPADRVIDRGVVKTLVAATAVQVGLIMVTISKNLFPRREEREHSRSRNSWPPRLHACHAGQAPWPGANSSDAEGPA